MNKVFLIDDHNSFDYSSLLVTVSSAKSYYPYFKTIDIKDLFINLIIAIINDLPLTLIDSDLNESELSALGLNSINKPVELKTNNTIVESSQLTKRVLESKSEITLFTSGTTGQPKKVVHSLNGLTRFVKNDNKHSHDVWGFAYNPTHIAGLQVFLQALININTIIILFNKEKEQIFDFIDKYKITHLSATPTFYRLICSSEKSFTFTKKITLGGERSSESLYAKINALFPNAKISNIYASTEAGSLLLSKNDLFKIPEEYNKQIVISEENELLIHKSLIGNSEIIVIDNGYYATGDIVEWVDKDGGFFRISQRKNELINTGGYKVNPVEIEEVIRLIRGVEDVLVFGKPNSVLGNILCADIKVNDEFKLDELGVRAHLSSLLQSFKIPRKLNFVDSIKQTRTGKAKRV